VLSDSSTLPHHEADTTVIPTVAPYPENATNMTNEQEVHSRQNMLKSVNMVLNAAESYLIYIRFLASFLQR
jgi:hypothetical protein